MFVVRWSSSTHCPVRWINGRAGGVRGHVRPGRRRQHLDAVADARHRRHPRRTSDPSASRATVRVADRGLSVRAHTGHRRRRPRTSIAPSATSRRQRAACVMLFAMLHEISVVSRDRPDLRRTACRAAFHSARTRAGRGACTDQGQRQAVLRRWSEQLVGNVTTAAGSTRRCGRFIVRWSAMRADGTRPPPEPSRADRGRWTSPPHWAPTWRSSTRAPPGSGGGAVRGRARSRSTTGARVPATSTSWRSPPSRQAMRTLGPAARAHALLDERPPRRRRWAILRVGRRRHARDRAAQAVDARRTVPPRWRLLRTESDHLVRARHLRRDGSRPDCRPTGRVVSTSNHATALRGRQRTRLLATSGCPGSGCVCCRSPAQLRGLTVRMVRPGLNKSKSWEAHSYI